MSFLSVLPLATIRVLCAYYTQTARKDECILRREFAPRINPPKWTTATNRAWFSRDANSMLAARYIALPKSRSRHMGVSLLDPTLILDLVLYDSGRHCEFASNFVKVMNLVGHI